MIPSRLVYLLLLAGTAVGVTLATLSGDRLPPVGLGVALGLILLWDGAILALAIVDARRVRPHRVKVSRHLDPKLSIGRENPVTLTVKTGRVGAKLQIRDYYPSSFAVNPAQFWIQLEAETTHDLVYTVQPHHRGEYDWGSVQVRQLGAWGLAWHDWKEPLTQTIAVYPDLIGLRSLSIRLTLQTTGNIRRARRLGTGTEFAELRDYSMGDDPRFIDWKATARRSRPLVRVLEPEQEQTLIVLLDSGRLMTAHVNGLARFDWGLNATLSLAMAGLNRGDRVGVGVFDRQLHTWIPPERGQTHLGKLLERLTPIQPKLFEPDYTGAIATITAQQTRRALVVLITDLVDKTASAELLAAMGQLTPRYLPFCVTLRDPQVDAHAHALTQTLDETFTRAVALDLLNQRQLALALLKHRGVLILDAPAHQVSEDLVDRYLQLKAKGQL